jgi:serine protease SohB
MFAEFLLFAGKALVIVLMFGSIVLMIAMAVARAQHSQELEVEPLHIRMKDLGQFLRSFRLNKEEAKAEAKAEKKKAKQEKKSGEDQKKNVLYVLRFDGDIRASQVENLREEVTAILQASIKTDEVLCVLESPGGVVNGYGLAASQLLRIRDAGLKEVHDIARGDGRVYLGGSAGRNDHHVRRG